METIIQQITVEFVKKFLEHFKQQGIYDLGKMTSDGLAMSKELTKELITAFIEQADKALVEAKEERKKDGITIHQRTVDRSLYTALGEFSFQRTYFHTPEEPSFLLDHILGIVPYDRVDKSISAKMVNEAAEGSFGKSARHVTEGDISRQTAWRKTAQTGEVVILPSREKETPKILHIFADEDHVHLQNGKSDILPFITICKGKRPVCKGRNELLDPIHINGYGLKSEKLWEYAYGVCAAKYDMAQVEKIYLYGDGALWIGSSRLCFPNAVHIMDHYHFQQKMKILTAGETCATYRNKLKRAVRKNKKSTFQIEMLKMCEDVMEAMPKGKQRKNKVEALVKAGTYLLNHWKAVQNMKRPDSIGSCTEALVSHIFSERFSRNPMGWSKKGLETLSRIRVFIKNGGKILPIDIGKDKQDARDRVRRKLQVGKYEALVKQQQEEILSGAEHWRWFEHEPLTVSPSGTKVLLDSLGKRRRIA